MKRGLLKIWMTPEDGIRRRVIIVSECGSGNAIHEYAPGGWLSSAPFFPPRKSASGRPVFPSQFLSSPGSFPGLGRAEEGVCSSVCGLWQIRLNYLLVPQDLLTTTDKVLDVKISSLWTLAKAQNPPMVSGFLWAVEALVRRLCPWDHPFSFSSSNVLLHSQLFRPTFPGDYQISFSTPPLLQAQIPRHSLASLMHNKTNISITSLVLQKLDHLLPPNYGQGLRGSPYAVPGMVLIMSITSGGQALTNAEIIMDFGDTNGTLHCVFWDHNLFQGEGGWSDEGCQAQATNTTPTTQCICQHLTAFSILMSRHVIPKDPVLKLLSGLGLGASILALLMCLAVYRLVWRVVVRNRVAFLRHTALFNMVICLLIADTSFMGALFLPLQHRSPLCFAITFLWHYFYLATFFWMLAQALVLAHQLLFVFHHLSRHVVLSLMVTIGYLCPLGLVGVSLGVYLPQGLYLREDKCFINGNEAALYTFMGPVLTIVCVNGIVLAIVVLKLLRPSLSEGPPAEEKRQAFLGVLKALLLLTPIFGLTWGLGVATLIEEVSMVPHYVFTILNTLQVGGKGVAVLADLLDHGSHCQSLLKEAEWQSRTIDSGILDGSGVDSSFSTT